jgi:hypothetical protein
MQTYNCPRLTLQHSFQKPFKQALKSYKKMEGYPGLWQKALIHEDDCIRYDAYDAYDFSLLKTIIF